MSIKNWFGKSTVVRVDHGVQSPKTEADWEKIEATVRRRTKFFEYGVAAGLAVFVASAGVQVNNVLENVNGIDNKVSSEVAIDQAREQMGPKSQLLTALAGNERITVVSQDDQNLHEIIGSLNYEHLPDYRPDNKGPYQGLQNDFEDMAYTNFKGLEVSARYFALKYMQDPTNKEKAHITRNQNELDESVCFAQFNSPEKYDLSHGIRYNTTPEASRVGTAVHELAHCMDLREYHHPKPESMNSAYTVLQGEVIADATAAIYLASKSGNWGMYDNTTALLRELAGDVGHSTKVFVDQIKDNVAPESLGDLTMKEAFQVAVDEYQKLDFESSIDAMNALRTKKSLFEQVLDGHDKFLDVSSSPNAKQYWEENYGISDNASIREHMHEYSEGIFKRYLDHLSFTGSTTSADLASVIAFGEKLSKAFDNEDLAKVVNDSRDKIKNNESVRLSDFAQTMKFHDQELSPEGGIESYNNALKGAHEALFNDGGYKTGYPGYEWVRAEVKDFDPDLARSNFVEKHKDRDLDQVLQH